MPSGHVISTPVNITTGQATTSPLLLIHAWDVPYLGETPLGVGTTFMRWRWCWRPIGCWYYNMMPRIGNMLLIIFLAFFAEPAPLLTANNRSKPPQRAVGLRECVVSLWFFPV